jgi:hypothetical protein
MIFTSTVQFMVPDPLTSLVGKEGRLQPYNFTIRFIQTEQVGFGQWRLAVTITHESNLENGPASQLGELLIHLDKRLQSSESYHHPDKLARSVNGILRQFKQSSRKM